MGIDNIKSTTEDNFSENNNFEDDFEKKQI